MTNRNRMDPRGASEDWAAQVPRHDRPRGPYEDYGWERGESALPEFRDPSVHEMPYDRQREPGHLERYDRSGAPMSARPRRSTMRNPYDDSNMYGRERFSRSGYRRDDDYNREQDRYGRQSSGSYGRDYDQDRWRGRDQGRDIDYERWYMGSRGNDEYTDRDQERWRASSQRSSGPYRHDYDQDPRQSGGQGYTSFSPEYDQDRWRSERQGYAGGYGREYDQERWRASSQGYGGAYDMPTSWSYSEVWLIPGPFTGRGPRGYQRSDDRIREDVSDRLTMHGQVDASDVEVQVQNCEVTLTGTVPSREAKRMAEDAAESVQGVREVHNQLRVQQSRQPTHGEQGARNQSMQGQQAGQERAVGGAENRG